MLVMWNRMLEGTFPVSGLLLSPRASKAAPEATRQDPRSGCDILTPSPASSLKQALTWPRTMGAEAFHGERWPSAARHPTRLKPRDLALRGHRAWAHLSHGKTWKCEDGGSCPGESRGGVGWLWERPVLPERAWQQKERMFPKEDQLDTVPGRWAGAIPNDPCPRRLPFAYGSTSPLEGRGQAQVVSQGYVPWAQEPAGWDRKEGCTTPKNVCLMRARAGVWASATQRCLMPGYDDSAPNRPVTFLYLPRAPLNPEPPSKTWTQTHQRRGQAILAVPATGFRTASGWEPQGKRSSEKLGLFV